MTLCQDVKLLDNVRQLLAEGNSEEVEKLAAIRDDEGNSVLHVAAIKNDVLVINRFIELGIDVNISTCKGLTPLDCALVAESVEVAETLVQAGARLQENYLCTTEMGSLLHCAVSKGNIRMVNLLTSESVVSSGYDINVKGFGVYGITPLSFAITIGNVDVVKVLIEAGCDLTAKDSQGRTPLIYGITCYDAESIESYEIVKALILAGSDVNHRDNDNQTILQYTVAMDKDFRLTQLLLQNGADINASDSDGFLPIHVTIQTNNYCVFEGLIEAGAKLDWQNSNNSTILHFAMRFHEPKIIKLLLEKDAKIHAVNKLDVDPFCHGIALSNSPPSDENDFETWLRGKLKCLKLLLKQGADINRVSSTVGTALNVALRRDKMDSRFISFLLRNKAIIDFNDKAVQGVLCSSGKQETSRLLIKHVALCETKRHLNERVRNFDLCKVSKELQRYYRASKDELEEMKNWMIANEDFSLYDLLAAKKIIHYVRNEHTSETLEKASHAKLFPIYIGDLRRRFEKETKKQKRLDKARNGLSRLIKREVSSFAVVYDNILRFLSKTDLQTLSSI